MLLSKSKMNALKEDFKKQVNGKDDPRSPQMHLRGATNFIVFLHGTMRNWLPRGSSAQNHGILQNLQ